MTDVFLSYAREDKAAAARLAKSIEAEGYSVWWDPRLKPHQDMHDAIDAELMRARCIVVLWSKAARGSAWVRSEANTGLERGKLIQVRIDDVRPPRPFDQFQVADLSDWRGEPEHADRWALTQSVTELVGRPPKGVAPAPAYRATPTKPGGRAIPAIAAGAVGLAALGGAGWAWFEAPAFRDFVRYGGAIQVDVRVTVNTETVRRVDPAVQEMLEEDADLF